MVDKQKYKCAHCKNIIEVHINNIDGMLSFKEKYYHTTCFEEMATKKANSNRGKPEMWRDALCNLQYLKMEAEEKIKHSFAQDNLNEWLLSHYNITKVPTSFWQRLADLERGIYQSKRCKPISMETLLNAWQWGQANLDKIHTNNRTRSKGPTDDNARLIYDLAIIVGKVPMFLAYKAKNEAVSRELVKNSAVQEVDMSKIGQKKQEKKESISNIFDDLYVE